jgi:outer membrane protein assembly factor BamB
MKKQPIIWGIILVLLLSSMASIVIGFNTKIIDRSIQSIDDPMDSAWPTFGHDNRHTSQSPYSTIDNPGQIKWKYIIDSGFHSSPVIDNNGVLYIGGKDYYLHSINSDGTKRWSFKCNGRIMSSPALADDGTIYVGSWDNHLYAINPNGSLKWKFNAEGGIDGSPTVSPDGTILFGVLGPSNGRLYALNPDGTIKWYYDTGGWIYSTPAISYDNIIYFTSNDRYLYALNLTDGSLIWHFRMGDWSGSPSIGDDNIIYIASLDDYLYAVFPNGTIKWKTEIDYGSHGTPAIAMDGTIYIGGKYFYAINPDGSIKWIYKGWEPYEFEIQSSFYAISNDGIIYFVVSESSGWGGDLIALDENGTLIWRKTLSNIEDQYCSPIISEDGTVYVGSQFVESGYSYGFLYAFGQGEVNNNISIEIKGGFGFNIEICNYGDEPLHLVNWSITIDGPLVILGRDFGGTISEIYPGECVNISSVLILGVGRIDITVEIDDVMKSVSGLLIGFFVILY